MWSGEASASHAAPSETHWVNFLEGVPWDFYLHKQSDISSLRLIEAQMRQFLKETSSGPLQIGEIYGVPWTSDQRYYRARLLQDMGDGLYVVHFIDYGMFDTAFGPEIRSIPSSFSDLPPFSIRCCLKELESCQGLPCENAVYQEFRDTFRQQAVSSPLLAEFFPSGHSEDRELDIMCVHLYVYIEPNLFSQNKATDELLYAPSDKVLHWISHEVKSNPSSLLTEDRIAALPQLDNMSSLDLSPRDSLSDASGKRIHHPLNDSKKASQYKCPLGEFKTRGSKIKIYYTGGSGPHDFYSIFLDEEESRGFPEFNEELQSFYEKQDEVQEPLLEDLSPVAVYAFDSWHRGEIRGDACLLVDSGETIDLEPFGLRLLEPQFLELPPLAKACRLYQSSESWSKKAIETFESLFEEIDEALYMGRDEESGLHLLSPLSKEEEIPFQSILKAKELGCHDFIQEEVPPPRRVEEGLSSWDPAKEDYNHGNNTLTYRSDNLDCVLNQDYAIGPRGVEKPLICKFYRAKKSCPRGDKCKFLHSSLEDPNAFAGLDVSYTQMEELRLPEVESLVVVQVSSIRSLTFFYILLPWGPEDVESLSSSEPSPKQMLRDLNEELSKSCRGSKAPNSNPFFLSDVVAALHPGGDKASYWLRARIMEVDNGRDPIRVFFVDYGEEIVVERTSLRPLDPRFLHLPFQAIESGFPIEELPPASMERKDLWSLGFFKIVKGRALFARIIRKELDMKIALTLFYVNEQKELVNVLQELNENMLNPTI